MTCNRLALFIVRAYIDCLPEVKFQEERNMGKQCEFCGKKPQVGNLVSHSNIKTKRRFNPNLQNVRHQDANGSVRTVRVCARCLRSGVITKPVKRKVS